MGIRIADNNSNVSYKALFEHFSGLMGVECRNIRLNGYDCLNRKIERSKGITEIEWMSMYVETERLINIDVLTNTYL